MPDRQTAEVGQHVVMIVGNDVTNDTRVKKSALSVARMGFRVTIVAVAPQGEARSSQMGPVEIVRVPLVQTYRITKAVAERRQREQREAKAAGRQARAQRLRARLTLPRPQPAPPNREQSRVLFESAKREGEVQISLRKARLDQLTSGSAGAGRLRVGLERRLQWRRIAAIRAGIASERQRYLNSIQPVAATPAATGFAPLTPKERSAGWRDLIPELQDFERAYMPVLERLAPDIIHAHDFPMIGLAARHAIVAKAAGRAVKVVYDAHEYTAGVALPDPRRQRGYLELESEYIHHVDAVITVSHPIAERIAEHHGLAALPEVVLNTPLAMTVGNSSGETVRDVIGLDESIPLVVYSGNTSTKRRVELLVEAMAEVPDAHLVIVCSDSARRLRPLRAIAREGGYLNRFHVAPYAQPDQVSHYLSTATLGAHPLSTDHMNHQLALPNKLFEYLHAGLPMVVSNNQSMSAFVRQHNLGEVFEDDTASGLASALRTALADLERYDAKRLNPDLLAQHTWEGQEPALSRVYSHLLGQQVSLSTEIGFALAEVDRLVDGMSSRPTARPLADATIRLAIGPSNMAGQGFEWARAAEAVSSSVAVESFGLERGFTFPADVDITTSQWDDLRWQLDIAHRVLSTHTHVLFEAGLPLLGSLNGATFDSDLPALRQRDIAAGLILHGSEIRDPRLHRDLEQYSPFRLGSDEWTDRIQARVDDLKERIAAFDGVIFVSTLGLLDHVPDGRWLPVVVDPTLWAAPKPVLHHGGPPVVAHAPTSGRLKGTAPVVAACEDLAARGLIRFRRFEGIPYGQMPHEIRDADIVVDGLVLGDYGVTACQAMAAGRAVVGNVSDRVRQRVAGSLPIVQADPGTLASVLESLVSDPSALAASAAAGPEFVGRFHDGAYSGKILAEWLENSR